MNLQIATETRKKVTTSPVSNVLRHTTTRSNRNHTMLQRVSNNQQLSVPQFTGGSLLLAPQAFEHDFSQVPAHTAGACPIFPRYCSFGGACHTCSSRVQTKLVINKPGDKYEREADELAEGVMRMPESRLQLSCPDCEDEEYLQTIPLTGNTPPGIQRQTDLDEDDEEEEPVQAKLNIGHSPRINPGLDTKIQTVRSGGQPLPPKVRGFFEPRFGHDFSRVRVHSDTGAAETAQSLNAKAYTIGYNIIFGSGQYRPDTTAGQQLLAHELAHVDQQAGFRQQSRSTIQRRCGAPDPAAAAQPVIRTNVVAEAGRQVDEHYLFGAEGQYPGVGEVVIHPVLSHVARNTTAGGCVCAGKHSDEIVSIFPHGDPANPSHNSSPQNFSWQRREGAGNCGGCGVPVGSIIWGEMCEGHRHFDCSGYVFWCYNQAGYAISRRSVSGYQACDNDINQVDLQPGDLCYIGNHHVGIYIGGGNVLEARSHDRGVVRSPLAGRGWDNYGTLF